MRVLFFFVSFAILLAILPRAAAADDRADCKLSAPDVRIAACTRIIKRGGLDRRVLAAAYRNRAVAQKRRRDKDKVLADLNEAMRLDPGSAAYYRGLIYYYVDEDHARAIAELSEAITSEPGNAAIYNARGVAYLSESEYDHAIADFSEALRIEPGFVLALSNRGNAHRLKGDHDAAIADLGLASQLNPKFSGPYVYLAYIYGKKGDFDAAVVECDKAIRADPKHAEAYDYKAYLYFRKRDYDRAISEADKAIGLKPDLANAYYNRGLAYEGKRDRRRALADFDKAIEIKPKLAYPYVARAFLYIAKDVDRAIANYDKAIELEPKYTFAYFSRGKAYEKKNEKDLALADYRKVLELPAPSNTDRQRQEIARQRAAFLMRAPQVSPSPATNEAPQRGRVALVIGNSSYIHANQLGNPRNDASAVAASLRRLQFGQVIELYDQSREQMSQALKNFGDLAEGADWAVVYFAGHGLEMNGVTYLIPTDAELARDTHVPDETISLTQVQAKADAAAKLGLVILNSCRNNPFIAQMARSVGASRAIIGQGLANVEPEGNVLVAYSAKHGTTALDGAGAHSPFTEALLDHIEEPGLEINFLFRKIRDDVLSKTGRQQEPFLYGSLSAELLYFRPASPQH